MTASIKDENVEDLALKCAAEEDVLKSSVVEGDEVVVELERSPEAVSDPFQSDVASDVAAETELEVKPSESVVGRSTVNVGNNLLGEEEEEEDAKEQQVICLENVVMEVERDTASYMDNSNYLSEKLASVELANACRETCSNEELNDELQDNIGDMDNVHEQIEAIKNTFELAEDVQPKDEMKLVEDEIEYMVESARHEVEEIAKPPPPTMHHYVAQQLESAIEEPVVEELIETEPLNIEQHVDVKRETIIAEYAVPMLTSPLDETRPAAPGCGDPVEEKPQEIVAEVMSAVDASPAVQTVLNGLVEVPQAIVELVMNAVELSPTIPALGSLAGEPQDVMRAANTVETAPTIPALGDLVLEPEEMTELTSAVETAPNITGLGGFVGEPQGSMKTVETLPTTPAADIDLISEGPGKTPEPLQNITEAVEKLAADAKQKPTSAAKAARPPARPSPTKQPAAAKPLVAKPSGATKKTSSSAASKARVPGAPSRPATLVKTSPTKAAAAAPPVKVAAAARPKPPKPADRKPAALMNGEAKAPRRPLVTGGPPSPTKPPAIGSSRTAAGAARPASGPAGGRAAAAKMAAALPAAGAAKLRAFSASVTKTSSSTMSKVCRVTV